MRKVSFLAVIVGLAAAVGVSITDAATSSGQVKRVVISTRKLPKLGTVLVNSKELTLYMFVPDKRMKVTA